MDTSNPGTPDPAYHSGMRQLQDRCDTRRLADRLDEKLARWAFTAEDRAFIESRPLFFLATADASGRPDCSYKGGAPGFIRVTGADELAFPSYDGNGMFRSLGNIRVNPRVGLLFLRIGDKPGRLRINGRAEISFDDPILKEFPGGQILIRITPTDIFPNCPRNIPHLEFRENSIYAPREAQEPVEPAWKSFDDFKDLVPPRAR